MSGVALVSLEKYLHTSYSPDREYRDGVLIERNLGDRDHSNLVGMLTTYIGNRRKQWNIHPYISLRIKVRDNWYAVPDVCIYPLPDFEERYPEHPPLLWIEILSCDDRVVDVWAKAVELVQNGVPYVWVINPDTLESDLWTPAGRQPIPGKTFRLPESPIVIPLRDVIDE